LYRYAERVSQAAAALRDAEARAEARRVELETLRHLVMGGGANGTEGLIHRARSFVVRGGYTS
jgi:hypothetical protein